jgi:hypothetical protein
MLRKCLCCGSKSQEDEDYDSRHSG